MNEKDLRQKDNSEEKLWLVVGKDRFDLKPIEADRFAIEELLTNVNLALINSKLYSSSHRAFQHAVTGLLNILNELFKTNSIVPIVVSGHRLMAGNVPVIQLEAITHSIASELNDRAIEAIVFSRDLQTVDLDKFLLLMRTKPNVLFEKGGPANYLVEMGVEKIRIASLRKQGIDDEQVDLSEQAEKIYGRSKQVMENVSQEVLTEKVIELDPVAIAAQSLLECILEDRDALLGLTTLKSYDEYTFNHSVNVAIFSLSLGESIGLDEDKLKELGIAALLHDVGKVKIPIEVLNVPGRLSRRSWEQIQRHPIEGALILQKNPNLRNSAMIVAFEHHLKFDLSGYPNLTRERKLHPYSMIVSIADCYEALTSLRPYRRPCAAEQALSIMMRVIGRDFNPGLLRHFSSVISTYPVGSVVRLNTNEIAIVYRTNPTDGLRPRIKIIYNSRSLRVAKPLDMDLSKQPEDRQQKIIVKDVNPVLYNINVSDYLKHEGVEAA